MEDNLNIFVNGRRPQFFGNLKTTSIYCKWKSTSVLSIKTIFFFFSLSNSFFLVAEQLYVWSCLSVCLFVCLFVCLSVCPKFLSQIFVPNFVPNFWMMLCNSCSIRACFSTDTTHSSNLYSFEKSIACLSWKITPIKYYTNQVFFQLW